MFLVDFMILTFEVGPGRKRYSNVKINPLAGYPTWFILWKGGLVSEPDALALFSTAYLVHITVYFWYKFR